MSRPIISIFADAEENDIEIMLVVNKRAAEIIARGYITAKKAREIGEDLLRAAETVSLER